MNQPLLEIKISPEFAAQMKRIGEALSAKPDLFAAMRKLEEERRWREDPMNLMPYWRSAGDLLNLRKVCWALGDFFNSLRKVCWALGDFFSSLGNL